MLGPQPGAVVDARVELRRLRLGQDDRQRAVLDDRDPADVARLDRQLAQEVAVGKGDHPAGQLDRREEGRRLRAADGHA